ncbi:MAG: LuxR C-terminal-related transcriptional regulator [Nevskia sp.]|nr:LuxR C-terminal-related transcriptional regulator [Nevskia sp.]
MDADRLVATHAVAFHSTAARELERRRLLALDKGEPVLVAEAPSGYGKTVLARSWLRRAPAGHRCVWMSLDEGARDPTVFLEKLMVSLRGPLSLQREAVLDEEADHAERFAQVAEQLSGSPQPLWLVFDDAHELAGSPSRLYLRRLLLGTGPHLRIFIAMQPLALDVGLGELTARGKVCWIGASALALTRDEVEALARLRNHQPSAQQLDWLARATQGWPALVQLALAIPESGPHLPGSIARLGPVREYIYERFLARLQPAERDILWMLACVGNAPRGLLRALAPSQADPDAVLPRLFALGIVQQDEAANDPSVRLHPVMCEAVLRVLTAERGGDKARLLPAAARWYWLHGTGTVAVRLLLEAGPEHLQAAHDWLLELAGTLIFKLGQHQTLLELVEQWECAAARHEPRLDRMAAWALIFQRHFAAAQERLRRALAATVDAEAADETQLQQAAIYALRDDHKSAGRHAYDWLQRHRDEASFQVGVAWGTHGFYLKCIGDIAGTRAALREAHAGFNKAQSGYGTAWVRVLGALAMVKFGRHRDALAEVGHGLEGCGSAAGLGGQRAMLRGVEAFVRYERNELSAARDILDEALPLLPDQGVVDTIVLGFTAAARVRAAAGDLGAALDVLSEGERCGLQREFPRLSLSLIAERALILARSGATDQARYTAEAAGLVPDSPRTDGLQWDRARRLHARLALAAGDPGRTRDLLAPLLAHTRGAKQDFKLCELLILSAVTADRCDDETAAFDMLREALALAVAENYVRVFVDEGPQVHGLLRRWLRTCDVAARMRPEARQAEQIVAAVDAATTRQAAAGEAPVQPLNRRERQILSLLDQGLSNAEIAARCFVVEGTVKWNLHNLYSKLGVRSRTAALRAARAHGILRG